MPPVTQIDYTGSIMKSEHYKKRVYRLGKRQIVADKNRAKIVAAARKLLAGRGSASFSMDAVAQKAGVARMTVYHQFGSKRELLEALFDHLAGRSLVTRL